MPDRSDLYHHAESLYQQVLDLAPPERAGFLERACGGDQELLTEVETLLTHYEMAQSTFLNLPAHHFARKLEEASAIPERIAGYQILGRLGEGGMGTVYRAQQEQPRRQVALKVIRPGLLQPRMRRRFELEAEVLGRLKHPGIAQIYEAGTYDDGGSRRPFFAMELVEGVPLLEYARDHRLDRDARLELIARACDAVHHAHLNGVIHRDLKPGNILVEGEGTEGRRHEGTKRKQEVTELRSYEVTNSGTGAGVTAESLCRTSSLRHSVSSSLGTPKVLDFGVARLVDSDLQSTRQATQFGEFVGTLPYMSPEQVHGDPEEVDIRSDVYSLGVIAFELLSGRLPHDLRGRGVPEVARIIREEEPARLGTVGSKEVPARELRGDIETVVGKALEKERGRRYSSAAEFAADIRRVVRGETVSARPATALYQLSKFAKRNRVLVGAAGAIVATLVVAAIWSSWSLLQARQATERATAMNEFLEGILATADPATGRADVRFVEVLREASDEAATRFAAYPETEADVRMLLAQAYSNMSLYREALVHASRAFELRTTLLGPDDARTLAIAGHRADLLKRVQRSREAREAAEDILAHTPAQERDGQTALAARRTIAVVMAVEGDTDAAERELRAVLDVATARFGDRHPVTLASTNDLAWFLANGAVRGVSANRQADAAESAILLESTLEPHTEVYGEDSFATLTVMANLTRALLLSNRVDRARAISERVLEVAPARFGEDHAICQQARTALVEVHLDEGRYEEAARLALANVHSIERTTGGTDNPVVLSEMSDVLPILDAGNRLEAGLAFSRTLCEQFEAISGHGTGQVLRFRVDIAHFVSRLGEVEKADKLFAPILKRESNVLDQELKARIDLAYGAHLVWHGQFAEAEIRLRAAEAFPWLIAGMNVVARQELVRLYEAWGRQEAAKAWRAQLPTGDGDGGAIP